jgi:hypothetical protein
VSRERELLRRAVDRLCAVGESDEEIAEFLALLAEPEPEPEWVWRVAFVDYDGDVLRRSVVADEISARRQKGWHGISVFVERAQVGTWEVV